MNDVDSASMEELEAAAAIYDNLKVGAEEADSMYDLELEAHVRELYGLLDMAQIKHTTWDFTHNSL